MLTLLLLASSQLPIYLVFTTGHAQIKSVQICNGYYVLLVFVKLCTFNIWAHKNRVLIFACLPHSFKIFTCGMLLRFFMTNKTLTVMDPAKMEIKFFK